MCMRAPSHGIAGGAALEDGPAHETLIVFYSIVPAYASNVSTSTAT